MNGKALEYLSKDYLINCNVINAIKEGMISEYLYEGDDGVLIRAKDGMYYFSTDGKDCAKKILGEIDLNKETFVCQHPYDYQALNEKMHFEWNTECYQVAYNGDNTQPVSDEIEIKRLDESYAQTISEKYNFHPTIESARKSITEHGVYGAFIDNELAGFIGFHGEHSIGMLEVFPNFKRRGIGTSLINYMVNLCKTIGRIPYCHIIITNNASYELHKKLDCVISDTTIFWCGFEDD